MALLINIPDWSGLPAPNFSQAASADSLPVLDEPAPAPVTTKFNVPPHILQVNTDLTSPQLAAGFVDANLEDGSPKLYPIDQGPKTAGGGLTPPPGPALAALTRAWILLPITAIIWYFRRGR